MKLYIWAFAVCVVVSVCTVSACNEAICASLVSKCMLIKCCECDMSTISNCTCCADCHVCLKKHYFECCSCVGLCAPPDPHENSSQTSTVEELNDPIPELFNILTEEQDILQRWSSFSYPVHYDLMYYKPSIMDVEMSSAAETKDNKLSRSHSSGIEAPRNCTVAFMSQCTSLRKCKSSCKSMGAARYRWFHEHGCCECVSPMCINYGLTEPKCLQCPLEDDEDEAEEAPDIKEALKMKDAVAEVEMEEGDIEKAENHVEGE